MFPPLYIARYSPSSRDGHLPEVCQLWGTEQLCTILMYCGRHPYRLFYPDLVRNDTVRALDQGGHSGKASVMFLPVVFMNSSDPTCIYSTLAFVTEHARRHDVSPIITSDQPLWWTAVTIIRSEPLVSHLSRIVLRFGGFHAETSFLGFIGHVTASSGLQELLYSIYILPTQWCV